MEVWAASHGLTGGGAVRHRCRKGPVRYAGCGGLTA